MIEEFPILITGCPRSGASIIASAISLCGAFSGEISKRGMWSNDVIREEIVKSYIRDLKYDTFGQYPLPITNDLIFPMNWGEKVEKVLLKQGYQKGKWMYKDPLSSLIWPVWNYAFPNAKWIIVRRRTGDIIQSCLKTAYMFAFESKENQKAVGVSDEKEGWLWWEHEYEKRFVEMIEAGLNCKIVWPERMIYGDYTQMYEMLDWLGLKWNKEVINLIDPLLWYSKQKEKEEKNGSISNSL
jgi:hypothetical protein